MLKTQLLIIRWNVASLLGWIAVALGIIGTSMHYFMNIYEGVWFGAIGLIGGGLTVTFSGPLKTVVKKEVDLKPSSRD